MSGSAVFEKLPAIPRAPTKLRGFHRGTPQQRGSQPIVATTKATGQVLSIKASALYTEHLLKELSYLPLAVMQAAACIEASGMTV
jgi:hypothetical protein